MMSRPSRRDLVNAVRPRYRRAGRVAKRGSLDEFVAPTGYQRKYVIQLLKQAAHQAGLAEDKISIVLDEFEAVREAVSRTGKEELVVLMIDKPAAVWQELEGLAGRRTVL